MGPFAKCRQCGEGDLVPLSDFSNQGASLMYKAWVCTNIDCGYNMKIRSGEIVVNEPITSPPDAATSRTCGGPAREKILKRRNGSTLGRRPRRRGAPCPAPPPGGSYPLPSEGAALKRDAGVQHPRQDVDVAHGVEEDAGPPQHPVDREVDIRLLAQRLVPGGGCARARPRGPGSALIVCMATPRSGHSGRGLEVGGVLRVLHHGVVVGQQHGVEGEALEAAQVHAATVAVAGDADEARQARVARLDRGLERPAGPCAMSHSSVRRGCGAGSGRRGRSADVEGVPIASPCRRCARWSWWPGRTCAVPLHPGADAALGAP